MKELLQQLLHGTPLTVEQTESAFTLIMEGAADAGQTAAMLTLLAVREPTIDELTGAALVMRRHVVAIDAPENVIDTCGTGGACSQMFNVSTAAALVAAACGVPVAKHGNRSVTSRSGSSDVLRALGVNIETTPAQEAACLKRANICFAFAPKHHPAMKHVAALRGNLGFSTIFNLVGPLANPAGARSQLIGTRTPELADKLLEVLVRLGVNRALVVNGRDPVYGSLCEISITGGTHVAQFDGSAERPMTTRYWIEPEELGLKTISSKEAEEHLVIRSPEDSARRIKAILQGQRGPARDLVLANAAAALWVGKMVDSVAAGVPKAAQAIDSGAGLQALEKLIECSCA